MVEAAWDSDEGLMSSEDEAALVDPPLPELGSRTSSGPRRNYLEPSESFAMLEDIGFVKPVQELSSKSVNVFARFRPDNQTEVQEGENCIMMDPDQVTVTITDSASMNHSFQFLRIFPNNTIQEDIYNTCAQPLIHKVIDGYNTAILAYGQTGSGKTFSLFGPGYDNVTTIGKNVDPELRGVCPRLVDGLFRAIYQSYDPGVYYQVAFSYIEIYNEKIRDCLTPSKDNLTVYNDTKKGLWVTDATKVPVKNTHEILKLMQSGSKNRTTASTNSNMHSSRSHAIIIMTVQKTIAREGRHRAAQLYVVDLCGSEKTSKTGAQEKRLEEAQYINKSLLALGNVIAALSTKRPHIPYRDSKLTRLLQNSFGGNSYTSLILCCSSNSYNGLETKSTLKFGERANLVTNKPVVNQTESVQELRRMLGEANFKIQQYQVMLRELTMNNAQLENMLAEAYSSLDARTSRAFQTRYKNVAIQKRGKNHAQHLGAGAFYQIFIFLPAQDIARCRSVCKRWNERGKDEYL